MKEMQKDGNKGLDVHAPYQNKKEQVHCGKHNHDDFSFLVG